MENPLETPESKIEISQLHENVGRQTFEDFLQEKHAEGYHGTDDDMPDACEAWICELDVQEVMELAQEWGNTLV